MFSGIIEKTTEVLDVKEEGTNKVFSFRNVYGDEIYIDQSISHNGACLTVVSFDMNAYQVVAIDETLKLTNLNDLTTGSIVNLERSVKAETRMDGHMVQGHVDSTAEVLKIENRDGSWEIALRIPADMSNLLIKKGSITLNGISLTIKSIVEDIIEVAIIPYTYEMTNIHKWQTGDKINVEFDMMGKYIVSYLEKINAR